jgi:hypothetical protein
MSRTLFFLSRKKSVVFFLLYIPLVFFAGCGFHRYTNLELRRQTVVTFPGEYKAIIEPLNNEIIPISKRIYFLKRDVDELKDKLWEEGLNQRIMRIDNNIDIIRKEISALSAVRREILNTIYYIYPEYVEPQIVPYIGEKKKYKKFTKPIILVTLQDRQEYLNSKSNNEKMSESVSSKYLIATALKQFKQLPDSLKPSLRPIGSPGAIGKIQPYTPPVAIIK